MSFELNVRKYSKSYSDEQMKVCKKQATRPEGRVALQTKQTIACYDNKHLALPLRQAGRAGPASRRGKNIQ